MNRRMLTRIADAAFAVGLAAVAVTEIWLPLSSVEGTGDPAISTAVVLIMTLSLAARRGAPLPVALAMLVWPVTDLFTPVLVLFWGQLVPLVIATYSVARHGRGRQPYLGGLVIAACLLYFDLNVEELQGLDDIVFHWLVIGLAWVVGLAVAASHRRAEEAKQRAIDVEAEARTRTLQALADERARIARELHDIVAHSVSVMVVQAGAAEQAGPDDAEFTRRALGTIRTTGAEALAEMRRVVAMLRTEEGEPAADGDLEPQPGTAQLPALVREAQETGLDVELRVEGDRRPLPTGLDLAVYRIVQEALTNIRRHADATAALVVVRYRDDAVELEVRDDGLGGAVEPATGNGLIGMRERAELYGGRLETIPSATGFTVRAVLPVGAP